MIHIIHTAAPAEDVSCFVLLYRYNSLLEDDVDDYDDDDDDDDDAGGINVFFIQMAVKKLIKSERIYNDSDIK